MKKFISLLCGIAVLLLTGCGQQAQVYHAILSSEAMRSAQQQEPQYTEGIYEVKFFAELLSNDSVGNDWSIEYTCAGERISSGKQWTAALDCVQTVTVDVTVTEDDKWPDTGTGSFLVDLQDGFETSSTIIVTEDQSRYKDHTAQWKITCKTTLVGCQ